eukprot:TRINITY_DN103699_c0_g1_i1.p1 TRINITY_DN103699_c0_g1~~TRINITY_DN103699_c0_g1_i1.p1  ORF type:complete len:505 (+),score=88.65 TRINITY_DN103699_c0_g1_i1:120-1634(+)
MLRLVSCLLGAIALLEVNASRLAKDDQEHLAPGDAERLPGEEEVPEEEFVPQKPSFSRRGATKVPGSAGLREEGVADEGDVGSAAGLPQQVRIAWMRHGFSCANLAKATWGKIKLHLFFRDPLLTNWSVAVAKTKGVEVRRSLAEMGETPHAVFSSHMIRAMETALYNFPGERVYPIPYIGENDWMGIRTSDNKPLQATDDQKELMKKGMTSTEQLTFTNVSPENHPERQESDYQKFLKFFPKMLKQLNLNQSPLSVAIVSHSHYMKENLNCEKSKPRNNDVWIVDYVVDKSSPEEPMLRRSPGGCRKIDGLSVPTPPGGPCQGDTARCAIGSDSLARHFLNSKVHETCPAGSSEEDDGEDVTLAMDTLDSDGDVAGSEKEDEEVGEEEAVDVTHLFPSSGSQDERKTTIAGGIILLCCCRGEAELVEGTGIRCELEKKGLVGAEGTITDFKSDCGRKGRTWHSWNKFTAAKYASQEWANKCIVSSRALKQFPDELQRAAREKN